MKGNLPLIQFNWTQLEKKKAGIYAQTLHGNASQNIHFSEQNKGVRVRRVCAVRTSCKRSRDLRSQKQKDAQTQAASSRKLSHRGSAGLPPRLDWGARPSAHLEAPHSRVSFRLPRGLASARKGRGEDKRGGVAERRGEEQTGEEQSPPRNSDGGRTRGEWRRSASA